jgi:hypothetical protein
MNAKNSFSLRNRDVPRKFVKAVCPAVVNVEIDKAIDAGNFASFGELPKEPSAGAVPLKSAEV